MPHIQFFSSFLFIFFCVLFFLQTSQKDENKKRWNSDFIFFWRTMKAFLVFEMKNKQMEWAYIEEYENLSML